jgi:UDP-N-acetylglucosamine 1-carboxyvinyltransferase
VLNKQIIAIGGNSVSLKIEGGQKLHGEIELKTSKNATVAILCAALLNKGVTKLKRVPRIEEVNRIIEVLLKHWRKCSLDG